MFNSNFVTPFLLFTAFLLLLLVSLSVPIIKTIWFFGVTADASSSFLSSSAGGDVHFGLWGYCTSAVGVSIAGIKKTAEAAECSPTKLGYTFDSTLSSILGINGLENTISKALTAVLVLHPIACGLVFLALIPSLFMCLRRSDSRPVAASMMTMVFTLLSGLITLIVFIVDIVLVSVVRSKIKDISDDFSVQYGAAVWMVLVALLAQLFAITGACMGMCGCGNRYRSRRAKQSDIDRY